MRVVVPVTFEATFVPKNGKRPRTGYFVDHLDWEIPAIDGLFTKSVIFAWTPVTSPRTPWVAHEWRVHEGGMIRALRSATGIPVQEENLPRWDGPERIKSNFVFEFMGVLGVDRNAEHNHLAHSAIADPSVFGRFREIPGDRIIACDRDEALAKTVNTLSKLVMVDGMLWRKTFEPHIRLTVSNLSLISEIVPDDGDEGRFPKAARQFPEWEMTLPFHDHAMIAAIETARGLPASRHVQVDFIADDAPVTTDTRQWHARSIASRLLEKTSSGIGAESGQAISEWTTLRGLIEAGETSSDAMVAAIDGLLASLSPACRTLVAEAEGMMDMAAVRSSTPRATLSRNPGND